MSGKHYNSEKLRAIFAAKQAFEESSSKDANMQRKVPESLTDVTGVNHVVGGALSGSISRPYGEVLDDMEHDAKYKPHPVWHLVALLREALTTMNHARVFIETREKMHPIGVALYDDLVGQINATLALSSQGRGTPPPSDRGQS